MIRTAPAKIAFSFTEREGRELFGNIEGFPGGSGNAENLEAGKQRLTSAPRNPEERRAHEEKQDKARLAEWEQECEKEPDLNVIRVWIEDYQKGVEQYRLQ